MSCNFRKVLVVCLGVTLAVAALALDPAAQKLLDAGRVDDALRLANARIQSSPQDPAAYHLAARAYFQMQDWDKAVQACNRAVAFAPDSSDYHMWLGRADGEKAEHANFLSAMGWAKKSRREFERAVQLDPANVAAHSDLAEFYIDAPGIIGGGTDKAGREADVIEKQDPALAHYLRARIADKNKDTRLVEQEMAAAIQAGKDDQARYWLNLASFYEHWKRYDDMENAINKAMAAPKKRTDVIFYAAELMFRNARSLERTETLLRQYLANPDEDGPAFQAQYLLGQVLERLGRKPEAARAYQAALGLFSGFDNARTALRRMQ